MISTRVIPTLLLSGTGLVKTVKFDDPTYVGDPRNAVKIFNDKEVDELLLVDILATVENHPPQFELIREIVSEAFMPVAYGGGIRNLDEARHLLALGVEKIVLGTQALENPDLVTKAAELFGSQSVLVCIDVRRSFWGGYNVYTRRGRQKSKFDPVTYARKMEALGAGELIIQSIDRDGTMQGYDLEMAEAVCRSVSIPVIVSGGAGNIRDLTAAVKQAGASAVAAGSLFVFHGKHRAVLVNYPDATVLRDIFK